METGRSSSKSFSCVGFFFSPVEERVNRANICICFLLCGVIESVCKVILGLKSF